MIERWLPIGLAALVAGGCCGLDELREGRLDVAPAQVQRAADCDDPALDAPLLDILWARVEGGVPRVDENRVVQAIRGVVERDARDAIPACEELVFDPSEEVRIEALFALERFGAVESLPAIAECAMTTGFPRPREQAYHAFSVISGERVNLLDEEHLRDALARHAAIPAETAPDADAGPTPDVPDLIAEPGAAGEPGDIGVPDRPAEPREEDEPDDDGA